ncbi:GNAT family N-acetyltransferase [uncultured Abiotrophia sp.]|uniref:GNAT family N-acetyltransferase n=1 Tax=uncultured Abiotrophia sp. TaxID=316094 RepID=UPI002604B0C4|nr:GNAT family N-acetyltransferase [uncultured Abiotrophia sp.]
MTLSLREITGDNYFQVLELKISPEQEAAKFVSPVVRSLADAWYYRDEGITYPKAIYAKEDLVGFIMYDLDTEEQQVFIWRFLIDQAFQGRGYGRQTIEAVLEMAKQQTQMTKVVADYVDGNEPMKKILLGLGFEETGFNQEINEHIMVYQL